MLWTDPFTPLITRFDRTAAFVPAADVMVSDGDLVLTLDLPGMAAEDVSIELEDDYLVVRGERTRPQGLENGSYVHAERLFGAFERRVVVPRGVDADSITASMEHGVLKLVVPKPERMRPRTIAVGSRQEERQLEGAAA